MVAESTQLDELIEAALRLVGAPEGGRVHTARLDGESLAILVDYGIGGIKKWVVPLTQIQSLVSPDSSPAIQSEQVAPSVEKLSESPQPEPTKPAGARKRRRQ